MSWSEFFTMGGYAFYVWGSFGVAAVLLVGEVVLLRRRKRALMQRSRQTQKLATLKEHETTT